MSNTKRERILELMSYMAAAKVAYDLCVSIRGDMCNDAEWRESQILMNINAAAHELAKSRDVLESKMDAVLKGAK